LVDRGGRAFCRAGVRKQVPPMHEPAILAPILTSLVGLVGVLVAGLSVYFNYKGRHNQFRQVVYSKQMDAYFEITGAIANLHSAAQNMIAFGLQFRDGPDGRKKFQTALRDEHEQFYERVNRWLIVLPAKVKAALDNFDSTMTAVSDDDNATDPATDLAKAYERVVNCIRHHLAVDNLTMGMLREMGIGAESFVTRNRPGPIQVMALSTSAQGTR
jgi:hypothetical protein